jgi:hypothetical protein
MRGAQGGGDVVTTNANVEGATGNTEVMQMIDVGVERGLARYDKVVTERVNNRQWRAMRRS